MVRCTLLTLEVSQDVDLHDCVLPMYFLVDQCQKRRYWVGGSGTVKYQNIASLCELLVCVCGKFEAIQFCNAGL